MLQIWFWMFRSEITLKGGTLDALAAQLSIVMGLILDGVQERQIGDEDEGFEFEVQGAEDRPLEMADREEDQ